MRRNRSTGSICSGESSIGAWPMPANSMTAGLGPRVPISAAVAADSRSDCAPRNSSVRTPDRVPQRPQVGRRGRGAKRDRDRGIVGEPPTPVRPLPHVGARDVRPLLIGQIAERRGDRADVGFDLGVRGECRIHAEIAGDALQRRRFDRRTHVVDDQPRNRRFRHCRRRHAEEAAHRRADPIDGFRAAARDQRRQYRQVRREDVVVRIGEPIALAAPRHVDRQDAMRRRERLRQNVEVAARCVRCRARR